MQSQVVGHDQLQSLADHGQLGTVVVAEGSLQHLRQERSSLKVIVDELLKGTISIDVAVQVVRQHGMRDTFHTGRQFGGLHLVLGWFPVHRFDPIDAETLLVSHVDLPSVDRQHLSIAVSDEEGAFVLRKSLDVANGETQRHVAFVVRFPVLHEVPNLLDVNPGARHLPESSMRGLATGTGLTLVALFSIQSVF